MNGWIVCLDASNYQKLLVWIKGFLDSHRALISEDSEADTLLVEQLNAEGLQEIQRYLASDAINAEWISDSENEFAQPAVVAVRNEINEAEDASVMIAEAIRRARFASTERGDTLRPELSMRQFVRESAALPGAPQSLQALGFAQSILDELAFLPVEENDGEALDGFVATPRQGVTVSLRNPRYAAGMDDSDDEEEEELPRLVEATMAAWPMGKLRRCRQWLVFQEHTWEYVQGIYDMLKLRSASDGPLRCLQLLHENGWLSAMTLHYTGDQRKLSFTLDEKMRAASEHSMEEVASLHLGIDHWLISAGLTIGEVIPEEKRGRGALVAMSEEEAPRHQTIIVKTNDPATLEFWLRRTPFTLFQA